MNIFVIVLLMIVISGVSYNKTGQWEGYMSKENCIYMKGVCALAILLHHLSQQVPHGGILWDRMPLIGGMSVSIFFFISGYGLMKKKCDNGKKSLDNYWKARIQSVGLPWLLVLCVSIFIDMLIKRYGVFSTQAVGVSPTIIRYSWFVVTISVLYIIYYIVCIVAKERTAVSIFLSFIFLFIYSAFCASMEVPTWWYISSYAFISGLIFKYKEEVLLKKMGKRVIVYVCGVWVCFIMFFLLAIFTTGLLVVSAGSFCIAYSIFPLCIVLIQRKIRVGNKILKWSGEHAYELYLIQGIPIQLLKSKINEKEQYIYVTGVLIISCVGAGVLKKAVHICVKG